MRHPIKILITEDEAIIAMCLKMELQQAGYTVCGMVARGEDAVMWVEREKPDIVLMDIGLPGDLNGIEAARQIRKHHDLPIIFMTGYQEETLLDEAVGISHTLLFHKPVSLREVVAAIDSF